MYDMYRGARGTVTEGWYQISKMWCHARLDEPVTFNAETRWTVYKYTQVGFWEQGPGRTAQGEEALFARCKVQPRYPTTLWSEMPPAPPFESPHRENMRNQVFISCHDRWWAIPFPDLTNYKVLHAEPHRVLNGNKMRFGRLCIIEPPTFIVDETQRLRRDYDESVYALPVSEEEALRPCYLMHLTAYQVLSPLEILLYCAPQPEGSSPG